MIEVKSNLIVIHSSTTNTNISQKMSVFGRDSFELDLLSTDFIYIGFKKPIDSIFFNITSVNTNELSLKLEYFSGTWNDCSNVSDDTLGLFRSGFLRWDRSLQGQIQSELDGFNRFWYRLSISDDREALSLSGINLVFSDDYDLMLENSLVTQAEFLGSNKSHILYHSATKNDILQNLRNITTKINGEDLTQWDLIDIEEVKQASVYGTLAKIYYNMSDSQEDIWYKKASDYESKFSVLLQSIKTSLDMNDNGLVEQEEVKVATSGCIYMTR